MKLSELAQFAADELRSLKKGAGGPTDPVMRFTECTIECGFEVTKEGEAGVSFWFIDVGGSASKTESNTISLTFEAIGERVVTLAPPQ
jgi:hypothetical protein